MSSIKNNANTNTIETNTSDNIQKEMITKCFKRVCSTFEKVCESFMNSKIGQKIWYDSNTLNTHIYIAKIFINHYKESLVSNIDYKKLLPVLSSLKTSMMCVKWSDKLDYLRRACQLFVVLVQPYTGFSCVIGFEFQSGDFKTMDTEDIYDFLNEKYDMASIIDVNVNTFMIMSLQNEVMESYIEGLNNRIIDVVTENGNKAVFKVRTHVFTGTNKIPLKTQYSWKDRESMTTVPLPAFTYTKSGKKADTKYVPVKTIEYWNRVHRAYSKI